MRKERVLLGFSFIFLVYHCHLIGKQIQDFRSSCLLQMSILKISRNTNPTCFPSIPLPRRESLVACTQPCTVGQSSTSSPAANHECISRCTSVQPFVSSIHKTPSLHVPRNPRPHPIRASLSHGHTRSSKHAGRVVLVTAGLCPFGTPSRLAEPAPPMTAALPPASPRAFHCSRPEECQRISQSRKSTSHTSKKVGEHFIRILQTMVGGQIRSDQIRSRSSSTCRPAMPTTLL
jgi:hypothetical protein